MVNLDAFKHHLSQNFVSYNKVCYAYVTLYEHWNAKFKSTEILVFVNGTETDKISEIITLCQLYNMK